MNNSKTDSLADTFIVVSGKRGCSFQESAAAAFGALSEAMENSAGHGKKLVWVRIFLSDIINQKATVEKYLKSLRDDCAVSVIEQPPLDLTKINIAAMFLSGAVVTPLSPTAWMTQWAGESYIYQAFRSYPSADGDGYRQTVGAFEAHERLLEKMGLSVKDSTLRTWLFCRDIDSTYASVVRGRNDFFAGSGLTSATHFIASTGIGGYTASPETVVATDFLSRKKNSTEDIKYLKALSHLNPTAEYGVAFERGTAFSAAGHRVRLISGTASIDAKGRCIHIGDPAAQTERLVENIRALLEEDNSRLADICLLIVYFRDAADYSVVSSVFERLVPASPKVYVRASVCRPAWLVEAECIAISK